MKPAHVVVNHGGQATLRRTWIFTIWKHTVDKSQTNATNVTASSRAGHLRTYLTMHSGEKLNKCNQCEYASSKASDLRRHLKTHSGEKLIKCNQCTYASSDAGNLRKHLKTHSGENATSVIFQVSMQRVWSIIWTFTMEKNQQCNFASSWPDSLRKHLKTHKG